MQALMLAAGMGKRLGRFTENNTKCMLKIQEKTLIERAIEALLKNNINKMVVVTGYKGKELEEFLRNSQNPSVRMMEFVFVHNSDYATTNNIYSLFLAREELAKDDTILLESDLIYDTNLISRLVSSNHDNAVLVSKFEQWMDGTMIKKDSSNQIIEFIEKKDFNSEEVENYFKTVNIYKFSAEFSKTNLLPFLEAYIKAYGKNEYYELILKIIAHLSRAPLYAVDVSDLPWYEIDNAEDLSIAKSLFLEGKDKLCSIQQRYGGYWRFEKMTDFCYLVNPYYPTEAMMEKLNYFSRRLITQYPSGQKINCINASLLMDNKVHEDYLCVGNGAAELINALGSVLSGTMFVSEAIFNEYKRCFRNCNIKTFSIADEYDHFVTSRLVTAAMKYDILCVVSPDNPTGAHLSISEAFRILETAYEYGNMVIFDESFIDFAEESDRYTLLDDSILKRFPNLIVIKSISKSYGIPGVRLGVMATSNLELLTTVKNALPVWNINSLGEYFLQIGHNFKKEYLASCDKIVQERRIFKEALEDLGIKVYDSSANFLMCDLGSFDSTAITLRLLDEYAIFIKDLKTKEAFAGLNMVRLSVKTREENQRLVSAIKDLLN